MSIVEDYRAFMKHRWLCVYGASVALQVRDHMREGRGTVDLERMRDIKEEARTIADLDTEGESA
jgi:hypothetical protein